MSLKKILIVALVIIIPPFLVWLYLPGWARFNELGQENNRLQKKLDEMGTTNRKLQEQEYLLKNDIRYLETVLREELNVVRPDELVYKLVPVDEEELLAESKSGK